MLVTKLTPPRCPATSKFFATSPRGSPARRVTAPAGSAARTAASISAYGTRRAPLQRLPSKGMYSMKRTFKGRSRVSATKSGSSSSLTPRMTTALT